MTGIERLRSLASARDEWILGGTLAEIADQIERELSEERDRWDDDLSEAQVSWNAVAGVCLDMERHCLGHEGMEDSPVARWARELRGALKSDTSDGPEAQNPSCVDSAETADVTSDAQKVTRDPAKDVSMSAYDLLPQEDRDALAWVRDHGGLDAVKRRWECLSYYADPVPRSCMEKRLARLQRQIDECHAALRRRNKRIEELGHRVSDLTRENAKLRKRAMPEGCEWPRYESGEPVRIGDVVSDVEVRSVVFRDGGILLSDCTSVPGWGTWRSYKEPIKRPVVLAADGEPLEVGQTVYGTRDLEPVEIVSLRSKEYDGVRTAKCKDRTGFVFYAPDDLTHQRPVLDADGVPIKKGDTVWDVETGIEFEVSRVEGCSVTMSNGGYYSSAFPRYCPSKLTHTKPEIDTWQRIEDDAGCTATKYNERRGTIFTTKQQVARDLVRRCRALAERERGE